MTKPIKQEQECKRCHTYLAMRGTRGRHYQEVETCFAGAPSRTKFFDEVFLSSHGSRAFIIGIKIMRREQIPTRLRADIGRLRTTSSYC